MKLIIWIFLSLFSISGHSQTVIPSYPLNVSTNKTTNLIFPYSVVRVDIGSKDVLSQVVKSADSILQVKAAKQDFPQTNMSVVTKDGKLHCFLVNYCNDPAELNISFISEAVNENSNRNAISLSNEAAGILSQKRFLYRQVCDEKIVLALRSIYIDKDALWFLFDLHNFSLIRFKPGYIKFFIADNRRLKRTAGQEKELIPLFQTTPEVIDGKEGKNLLFAFPLFTLPRDKRMVCQISEENGGRLLILHIGHKVILKARPVSRL